MQGRDGGAEHLRDLFPGALLDHTEDEGLPQVRRQLEQGPPKSIHRRLLPELDIRRGGRGQRTLLREPTVQDGAPSGLVDVVSRDIDGNAMQPGALACSTREVLQRSIGPQERFANQIVHGRRILSEVAQPVRDRLVMVAIQRLDTLPT